VVAADENTALAVDVVAGQQHDAPLLEPMLDRTLQRIATIDQVVGDKGFDGDPQRRACRERDAEPVIPAKSNRLDPQPHDVAAYRERNRVERLIGKLKEFRRLATRFDKRRANFLGWLHLILGFIRLRAKTNVNRT
jgi:transposase